MGGEIQLQKAVMDYLAWFSKSHKIYYFRSGAGQVQTQAGRYFKTGKPGCPDISVCLGGRYYAIELKTAAGRQSALQKQAEAEIVAAGGIYKIVRSLSELKEIFPMVDKNDKA